MATSGTVSPLGSGGKPMELRMKYHSVEFYSATCQAKITKVKRQHTSYCDYPTLEERTPATSSVVFCCFYVLLFSCFGFVGERGGGSL